MTTRAQQPRRPMPPVEHLLRRMPRLEEATDRAIQAVLGKRVIERRRDIRAEVEQQFKEAARMKT